MSDAPRRVVTVEDSGGRVAAMDRVTRAYGLALQVFPDAFSFRAWLATPPTDVVLFSLDHHLGSAARAGTGLDAALALAALPPGAPVFCHSSDSLAAAGMQQVLADAGWTTQRFVFSERAWRAALERLFGRAP